jgi:multicomponent Na+:H+ antiporter subunit A
MTLAAYATAALLILTQRVWHGVVLKVVDSIAWLGPAHLYEALLGILNRLSHWLHELEVRDLRDRIASVLIPAGILVGMALLGTPAHRYLAIVEFGDAELPLVLTLLLAAIASVLTILQRTYLGLILALTGVGISLALVFALLGAPDVALVAVLVETALTLLFLAALALLPPPKPERNAQSDRPLSHATWWHLGAGLAAAGLFFVVAWTVLTEPTAQSTVELYSQLSQQAHADNIVAAIIADFRGLDTLGEITVIAIALLSIITFLQGVRKP